MRAAVLRLLQVPATALALAMLNPAHAQTWPTKPVRLVASFPPGTPGDVIARLIQPSLQASGPRLQAYLPSSCLRE
jgi:tripartite-type tricarboxylate transporter receptor subunit TctC